jgi:hypothetical protein
VTSQAEQSVPDGDSQQDRQKPDHEKRRNPALRLGFTADLNHDAGDLIGTARFCAPKAIPIGVEHEFPVGVGAPAQHRGLRPTRRKYLHLGIRHRLAVGSCKLRSDLVCREQVEGDRRRGDEEDKGYQRDDGKKDASGHMAKDSVVPAARQRPTGAALALLAPVWHKPAGER